MISIIIEIGFKGSREKPKREYRIMNNECRMTKVRKGRRLEDQKIRRWEGEKRQKIRG